MTLFRALARPLTRDARGLLARVEDTAAIGQAIAELLLTLPGERPMRPTWGSNLRRRRWDPNDETLEGMLRDDVAEAIALHERRATFVRCKVTRDGRKASLLVVFRVKATGAEGSVPLTIHEG